MPGHEELLDMGLDGLDKFVNSKYYDKAYDSIPAAKRRISRLRHRRRSRGQADHQQEVVVDTEGPPAPEDGEWDGFVARGGSLRGQDRGESMELVRYEGGREDDREAATPPPQHHRRSSQRPRSSVYEQDVRFRDASPRSLRNHRRDHHLDDAASLRSGPREPSSVYHQDRYRDKEPNYRVEAEHYDDDFDSRPLRRPSRRPPPRDHDYRGRPRDRRNNVPRSYDIDLSDRQLLSREIITEEYWPPWQNQQLQRQQQQRQPPRARSEYTPAELPDRTRALSASGLEANREPFSNRYYKDDTDSEDEMARNRKDFTRAYVETSAFNDVEAAAARASGATGLGRISPATTSDAPRRARSRSTRRPTFVEPLPSPPRSPIPGSRPVGDYMPAPHPRAAVAAGAMSQSRALILRSDRDADLDGAASSSAVMVAQPRAEERSEREVRFRDGPRSFSHSHHSVDRAEWDGERARRGSVRSLNSSTFPRRRERERERDLRPPLRNTSPPLPRGSGSARSSSRPPVGGIASTALGALAGGFVGTEFSKGNTLATVAAAVVGAVGAHEAERKYEKRRASRTRREDAGAYAALGSERERDEWDWYRRSRARRSSR
ncbi:hypothetical protein HDK64DRAFT_33747 [Phyllosticta capitalensis]